MLTFKILYTTMNLSLLLTLVASYLCFVEGEQCTTPTGGPGKCIKLLQCETLYALVRNPQKSQEDITRLQQSHCGFDGRIPKVCCPDESGQLQPLPGVATTQIPDDFCFTPDAQEGKCVSLSSCQHIVSLSTQVNDEIRAFIYNSKCDGPDALSVCCGSQPPKFDPPRRGRCTSTVAPQYPGSKCCGIEASSSNIIVGEDAEIDQFPWMALIEYSENGEIKLLCGGSLISGRYVLTAGHCVAGPVLNYGTPRNVRLGEYDTSNNPADEDCKIAPGGGEDCTTGTTVIPIEKIIAHEQYDPYHREKRNDIALLRLKEMAPYTDFIRPICLPQMDISSNLPNIYFTAAGWGYVNLTHTSSIKKYVAVPYLPMDVCQTSFNVRGRKIQLWNRQICAGGEANKDACKGDSGGPLTYYRGTTSEIVGVVSFGLFPCIREGVPGVYTKVYEYLPWIRKNIRP